MCRWYKVDDGRAADVEGWTVVVEGLAENRSVPADDVDGRAEDVTGLVEDDVVAGSALGGNFTVDGPATDVEVLVEGVDVFGPANDVEALGGAADTPTKDVDGPAGIEDEVLLAGGLR